MHGIRFLIISIQFLKPIYWTALFFNYFYVPLLSKLLDPFFVGFSKLFVDDEFLWYTIFSFMKSIFICDLSLAYIIIHHLPRRHIKRSNSALASLNFVLHFIQIPCMPSHLLLHPPWRHIYNLAATSRPSSFSTWTGVSSAMAKFLCTSRQWPYPYSTF